MSKTKFLFKIKHEAFGGEYTREIWYSDFDHDLLREECYVHFSRLTVLYLFNYSKSHYFSVPAVELLIKRARKVCKTK